MVRAARERSLTGVYHIVEKGCGDQLIFEDDSDRCYFLNLLSSKSKRFKISILAWCLMDNHFHLLLDDPDDRISDLMQAFATGYAIYFNTKCGRKGHVFQDRFFSQVISSNEQLLACIRYIHDNPAKAGLDSRVLYPWTSFHEYMGRAGVCKVSVVLDLLGGEQEFFAFSMSGTPNRYAFRTGTYLSDADALEVARSICSPYEPHQLKTMPKERRDRYIAEMKREHFKIDQIVRLTGVGRCTVQKVQV